MSKTQIGLGKGSLRQGDINNINNLFSEYDIDFIPSKPIYLNRIGGIFYKTYTQTAALVIKIDINNAKVGAAEQVSIIVTDDGITIEDLEGNDITSDILYETSDIASTTPGDKDEYAFWKDGDGVHYKITNLGQ